MPNANDNGAADNRIRVRPIADTVSVRSTRQLNENERAACDYSYFNQMYGSSITNTLAENATALTDAAARAIVSGQSAVQVNNEEGHIAVRDAPPSQVTYEDIERMGREVHAGRMPLRMPDLARGDRLNRVGFTAEDVHAARRLVDSERTPPDAPTITNTSDTGGITEAVFEDIFGAKFLVNTPLTSNRQDGSLGNGIILRFTSEGATVLTDFGNQITLNAKELRQSYRVAKWHLESLKYDPNGVLHDSLKGRIRTQISLLREALEELDNDG